MYFMMHEDSGKLLGSFNVAFLFSSLYILASSIKPASDISVRTTTKNPRRHYSNPLKSYNIMIEAYLGNHICGRINTRNYRK